MAQQGERGIFPPIDELMKQVRAEEAREPYRGHDMPQREITCTPGQSAEMTPGLLRLAKKWGDQLRQPKPRKKTQPRR